MLAEAKYVYLGWLFLLSSSDLSLEEHAPGSCCPIQPWLQKKTQEADQNQTYGLEPSPAD